MTRKPTTSRLLLAALLLLPWLAHAQEATPDAANRALASEFEAVWSAHDMIPLGELVTGEVDWVNVDGYRGQGRKAIIDGHARVHAGKFKDSVLTVQAVDVAVVRPGVAVVHVQWGLQGDRNDDGTPRPPREGLFTWLTVEEGGKWRIRASHNSNKGVVR